MVLKFPVRELEVLEVGERTKNIQTSALLKLFTILRNVLETWWDLLSLRFYEGPSSNADVKNSKV